MRLGCLPRHPAVAYLHLVRSMQRQIPTRAVLVCRFFALELIPFIGALTYSYFHQRTTLIALSVYSLFALTNASLSIKDGATLYPLSYVCERAKDPFGFWLGVFRSAGFAVLVLSFVIAFPNALVWPPK
jgi:hypothetical protein